MASRKTGSAKYRTPCLRPHMQQLAVRAWKGVLQPKTAHSLQVALHAADSLGFAISMILASKFAVHCWSRPPSMQVDKHTHLLVQ